MPDVELRFLTAQTKADTALAGLVMELDGTVWLVNPDGTREQLPGAGDGCAYLTCANDSGRLATVQVQVVSETPAAGDGDAYFAVESPAAETRAAVEAQYHDGNGASEVVIVAQTAGAIHSGGMRVDASEEDSEVTVKVTADKLHFDGGAPITRPTFDLSSGTLPQLAQALADLGLITAVP